MSGRLPKLLGWSIAAAISAALWALVIRAWEAVR